MVLEVRLFQRVGEPSAIWANVGFRAHQHAVSSTAFGHGLGCAHDDPGQGTKGNGAGDTLDWITPLCALRVMRDSETAAPSFSARSTTGCRRRRVSLFLWLSPATAFTIGSMMMSPTSPSFRASARKVSMSCAGVKRAGSAVGVHCAVYEVDAGRIGAHRQQTRE